MSFILSSGRTGTVFLYNVLSQLPGITAKHERLTRIIRIYQNMVVQGKRINILDQLLLACFTRPLSKLDANIHHYEINPTVKAHIDKLYHQFPQATYIHIVRDPRSHVASGINWVSDKPINAFFKQKIPFWSPKPSPYQLGQDRESKIFEMALLNWMQSNRNFLELKQKTSNYFILKFEDMVQNPYKFIKDLLVRCDYSITTKVEDILQKALSNSDKNKSNKVFLGWEYWDDKYILYLYHHCDLLMREFGYGFETEWGDRVRRAIQESAN